MQPQEKRSYIQLVKNIFKNINNPDYVRLNCKEWSIISLLMSIVICLPASIIIGIAWLMAPNEDSIFLCMLIPWVFAPIIFICVYIYNYWKPRRNDKVITRLFALAETDAPISPKSGCVYIFSKDNFLFEPYVQIEPIYKPSGNKKGNVELIILSMIFDCDYKSIQDYHALVEDMYAYSNGKQIGNHIKIGYNIFTIKLKLKDMTPEWIKKIVDEFIYYTERFNLRPITGEQYAECIEKINLLLSDV